MKPRYRPKTLTRAQKGVVPTLMDALIRAEKRTADEIERDGDAGRG